MDQEQNFFDYTPPLEPQPAHQPEPQPVYQPEPQPVYQPEPRPAFQQPTWGETVNRQASAQTYTLPYADCPYETPYANMYQPPKPKRKKKVRFATVLVSALLACALAVICCVVTATVLNLQWEKRLEDMNMAMNEKFAVIQNQPATDNTTTGTVTVPVNPGDTMTPGQVYAQNVDSVVAITAQVSASDPFGQSGTYVSSGSGFIISSDGYVVSNHHVVAGSTSIQVTTHSGQIYTAALVGSDDVNDVALLKIEGENLPYAVLGSSDALRVGDQVAAIGNPLGELTSTLTVGYVSAKDRMVATDGSSINMLQTDAAINSGNSGGPLFNMQGEVVGITTAKYSGTSSSGATIEGIGFAVPMDDVVDILADLREYGYVTSAYLGVMVRDVSAYSIQDGLPAGAYVESVTPGYAAEAAGLQSRDIIVNLAGYKVGSVAELTRILRKLDAGQTVSITVYRKGAEVQLSITLDALPGTSTPQPTYPQPGDEGFEEWYKEFMEDYYG